jgi:UDP-N-acetylglucosamine diphosphorylase/glucosamine-1-phosphate N-acetyltransferase
MTRKLAVVLAAGKGTRMKSELPKVLVPVCGRPMIEYVLDALDDVGIDRSLVVVGYRRELVESALAARPRVTFVEQAQQQGTGHAVRVCRDHLREHAGVVVVLAGDSPMVQRSSLARLLAEFERLRPACLMGTAHKDDPTGLGRIVRDDAGSFVGIVEEKDASDAQRQITEVNMSCYLFQGPDLLYALDRITNHNRQGEYYLTDCPGVLRAAGRDVQALAVLQPCETLSINDPQELLAVEAAMRAMHSR